MTDEEHRLLDDLIAERFGISFPEERRSLLERRLEPRLEALGLERFMEYYLRLKSAFEEEENALTGLITNKETFFFRETQQFEALFGEAWPQVAARITNGRPVRVLCAGCSSGEEPYTLRIYSETSPRTPPLPLEIDSFDIDTEGLAKARRAQYSSNALRAASDSQIRRFFSRTGSDRYCLDPAFRRDIRFSRGNILDAGSYPSQSAYDVLFCRNVLIYFSEGALRRAIENFARVLGVGGFLFLGHAESIIGLSNEFETVRFDRSIGYRRHSS